MGSGVKQPESTLTRNAVSIVILAAGASTRFGRPKQLEKWKGKSYVQTALDAAVELLNTATDVKNVILVLGANADAIRASLATPNTNQSESVRVIHNPEWMLGMSSSIRCGVLEAEQNQSTAVLLWTCDQLLVSSKDLGTLIDAYFASGSIIAASSYRGIIGVPAIFGKEHFPRLMSLDGDQGARAIIQAHSEDVVKVKCDHAAIDVDTQEDVERALGMSDV